MSVLNFWTSSKRALVGVDTFAGPARDGSLREASKFFYLPHANIIVAIRGFDLFLMSLFNFFQIERVASFDEAVERLPEFARLTSVGLAEQMRDADVGKLVRQQLVLVGWSKKEDGFQVLMLTRETLEGGFEATRPTWGSLPWNDSWGTPPVREASLPSHMEALAKAQLIHARRDLPNDNFGGRLIVAELTREGAFFESFNLEGTATP